MKHKSTLVLILVFLSLPLLTLAQNKTANKVQINLVYGKYGCTASKYRNGSVEYIPRGSFTISKNGQYT
ncbi:MAG TPA: hypothetical protein VK173_11690, partial [Lacibacter sp.]|nr:hypothetical protein [Lacibacter sp.]